MPDTSCRKCGDDLVKYSLCAECKQVTQKICKTCGTKTDDQFHEDCFYMLESVKQQIRTSYVGCLAE